MNAETFHNSLSGDQEPPDISPYLLSLWYDGKSNWDKAHHIIQDIQTKEAAWIHAYLHRKEGDMGNADYWYSRAGKKRPAIALYDEWASLVETFL